MSTSEQIEARTPPTSTLEPANAPVCSPEHTLSEQELDLHIRDCGRRMTAAFAAGDREDGCQWRDRMYEAIRSRTPEHQAKITARIDSAIWFQGEEALAMGKAAP
jgi:hypothetical protein